MIATKLGDGSPDIAPGNCRNVDVGREGKNAKLVIFLQAREQIDTVFPAAETDQCIVMAVTSACSKRGFEIFGKTGAQTLPVDFACRIVAPAKSTDASRIEISTWSFI